MTNVLSFRLTDEAIVDLDFLANDLGCNRADVIRRLLNISLIKTVDLPPDPDELLTDHREAKSLRAENGRLRAALELAERSMIGVPLQDRMNAWAEVVRALGRQP